jgi:hypothetical protein
MAGVETPAIGAWMIGRPIPRVWSNVLKRALLARILTSYPSGQSHLGAARTVWNPSERMPSRNPWRRWPKT